MVTDKQVRRLRKLMNSEKTKEIAALKAGMNVKTSRKYLRLNALPTELKQARYWRTRTDPFTGSALGQLFNFYPYPVYFLPLLFLQQS